MECKVECKVECTQDKEPENAFKHARWPTATCGSKLPTASLRSGPGGRGVHAREGCPSSEVSSLFGWCFAEKGASRDDFLSKMELKYTKMEPKWSPKATKILPKSSFF